MARSFSKSFYNSKQWKEVREYCIMRDHHACVYCGKPVDEVHHKIVLTPSNINDINITLNPDNLVCLCHDCHMKEHASEVENPYIFDENGMLIQKN